MAKLWFLLPPPRWGYRLVLLLVLEQPVIPAAKKSSRIPRLKGVEFMIAFTRKNLIASLLAALSLSMALSSATATAADYPQRRTIADTSAKYGLGVSEVPLLRRQPGP